MHSRGVSIQRSPIILPFTFPSRLPTDAQVRGKARVNMKGCVLCEEEKGQEMEKEKEKGKNSTGVKD